MKCLKDTQTGTITRVSDLEAYQKAGNRFQYVPKEEWKKTRPTRRLCCGYSEIYKPTIES